jgi:hypothetical protein
METSRAGTRARRGAVILVASIATILATTGCSGSCIDPAGHRTDICSPWDTPQHHDPSWYR